MERRCSKTGENSCGENKRETEKKVVVGVEGIIVIKPREDEEVEQTVHAHTMTEAVNSEDAVDKLTR